MSTRHAPEPVQVTKLRLAGFKSFGHPTELLIEPGLTGIVGPNGCGKSNLVDALRWVMGETSARGLRGDDMDAVIFAGTVARPPFDGGGGAASARRGAVLPELGDDDELQLSRRIGRRRIGVPVNGRKCGRATSRSCSPMPPRARTARRSSVRAGSARSWTPSRRIGAVCSRRRLASAACRRAGMRPN